MLSPILAVKDIEASIEFYTQKLGFKHEWSMPPGANGKTDFACVGFDGSEILLGTLEGYVAAGDEAKRGIGIQLYIELSSGIDIDSLYNQAKTSGVAITREIADRDWGERAFTFKDPDGYNYMLAKRIAKSS